jgi:broad specificity phosphatase PhoE
MSATTRWWWIRHAPVTAHDGRVYGQSDVPCDTSDAAAFRALAAMLPAGAVLVTSHLRRTQQTAAAIAAAGLALPEPVVEPDLAEQHLGAWQGRPRDEVYDSLPVRHPFWLAPADTAPPGGESFADLARRAHRAIGHLSQSNAGRDIIAVTHGGTIRAAIGLALGLSPEAALRFTVDNLSLTRLDRIGGPDGPLWRVVSVNRPAG